MYIGVTFILLSAVLVGFSHSQDVQQAPAAAPAPGGEDCNCQCMSLKFRDSRGTTYGNCESTINGAQWCYVKYDRFSPCPDLQSSRRFNGRYWSNHACATPAENSPECRFSTRPSVPFASSPASSVANSGIADDVF
ncbi:uncharacterized protein [Lepeophtheirus salmonis]|uniref:uncharacterized protein n=1 Tax=Lepeophtheirus salmonis TaxID=72036 RepID=UPI001AE168FF|nr:uncharacterized protein LOC121128038 [Lepeophtheirus salmonis]